MNLNHTNARTVRPLSKKGLHTRAAILEAARDVFREQGYYGTSVSEISRRAGMSQGAFYQYFHNKEQAFLELNDNILEKFWGRAISIDFSGPEPHLSHVIHLLLEHFRENYYFYKILGEFELIDLVTIGHYDSIARFLRGFFRNKINGGQIRPLDPNVISYGLIGLTSFHAMDWGPQSPVYDTEKLLHWTLDLWLDGVTGEKPWKKPRKIISPPPAKNNTEMSGEKDSKERDLTTAQAILNAAEQVFGEHGFNRAGIADITRRAGVAQGTFYVHFKSKRHLMEEFVHFLSRQIRFALKKATYGIKDRREVERAGIIAFFEFLAHHRRIYRVITESETMGQEMAMWYYRKLAGKYEPGVAEGIKAREIRSDLPAAFLARSQMGFIHMIGLKWLVWNYSPQAELPNHVLEDTIIAILEGLRPR